MAVVVGVIAAAVVAAAWAVTTVVEAAVVVATATESLVFTEVFAAIAGVSTFEEGLAARFTVSG